MYSAAGNTNLMWDSAGTGHPITLDVATAIERIEHAFGVLQTRTGGPFDMIGDDEFHISELIARAMRYLESNNLGVDVLVTGLNVRGYSTFVRNYWAVVATMETAITWRTQRLATPTMVPEITAAQAELLTLYWNSEFRFEGGAFNWFFNNTGSNGIAGMASKFNATRLYMGAPTNTDFSLADMYQEVSNVLVAHGYTLGTHTRTPYFVTASTIAAAPARPV
jgi:hypothetical protein